MSLENTISSAGYLNSSTNSSTSQINSQSLTQPFDPNIGPSDTYYLCDPMATQEPSMSHHINYIDVLKLVFSYEIHSESLMYLDSLLGQDPLACKDSDNSQVTQLKQQLTELQHAVASLQADRLRLINKNAGLNTTCQTLQNMIINMRGSASSVSSTSSSSPPSDTSNTIADEKPSLVDRIVPTESDRELDQKDYPSVKSWTKKEWQDQNPKTTSAVPGSSGSSSRGSGCMVQGINVACTYLQDEQGVPVSAQRAKTIRNLMLSSFRQLDTQGLAPDSIGQASLQVLHWLIHTLHKHCFEFHLCTDNWKVMKIMTDNYSQWFNYHVKKRTGKCIKAEHGESSPDHSEDTLPSVQKRRAQPEPITENDEAREPTPPPHANKGKDKEVTTIEIKNLLSTVVLKPRPKPVNRISPSISIDSPTASTSGTSPILAPPSTPSCTDAASLAVKAELINQSSTTIEMKAHPNTIKKRQPSTKPMRVSSKITARNLCAVEWQSNGHQKEPASVFATFWNGLSTTDKEVYKRKAALQVRGID
ncbi:hypothetical protein EDD22DRAFT_1029275 [Suillus occidentalis]|nr:hypothetical protein EDD22DRAFT_1029275 [Suillus occidentalis]